MTTLNIYKMLLPSGSSSDRCNLASNRLVEDELLTLGLLFQEPVLGSVPIQMRGHYYIYCVSISLYLYMYLHAGHTKYTTLLSFTYLARLPHTGQATGRVLQLALLRLLSLAFAQAILL